MKTQTLANGQAIPQIGFGTWRLPEGEITYGAVKTALASGYRHIDTAAYYQNEKSVGQAIKDSGINRKEVFLTTKVWNDIGTYEAAKAAISQSLKKLDQAYVDLLLIHWPNPIKFRENPGYEVRNREVWRALEEAYQDGHAKAIGVSNFLVHHLEALQQTAKIKPMINQIRLAPGLAQDDLVKYCQSHGILIEAYSPLGSGKIFDNDVMQGLAEKYDRTIAQVALRWSIQHNFIPLPRSQNPKNIESNLKIFDFTLSEEDMHILDTIPGLTEPRDPDTNDI